MGYGPPRPRKRKPRLMPAGEDVQALERFATGREIFEREKNLVWPWLIDLYQALLLFHEGRTLRPGRLCIAAAAFFDRSALREKPCSPTCCARIALQVGILSRSPKGDRRVPRSAETPSAPVLAFQAHLLAGQIAQARNERTRRTRRYLEARKALEALRSRAAGEELNSFVKNRCRSTKALGDLYILETGPTLSGRSVLLACREVPQLIELIFRAGRGLPLGETGRAILSAESGIFARTQLVLPPHRVETASRGQSHQRLEPSRKKPNPREGALRTPATPATSRENANLEASADFSLAKLQANLPEDATAC